MVGSDARVVVFIDYMNAFNDARAALCSWPYGPADGQFDPMRLGRLLASRQPLGTTGPDRFATRATGPPRRKKRKASTFRSPSIW
jgi:hypothetical protein